jgi:hypothetical protein
VFDLLVSMADFDAFKELMLAYRAEAQADAEDGGVAGAVHCCPVRVQQEEQEEGERAALALPAAESAGCWLPSAGHLRAAPKQELGVPCMRAARCLLPDMHLPLVSSSGQQQRQAAVVPMHHPALCCR